MHQIHVEREDIKAWLSQLQGASRGEHYRGLWRHVLELSAVPARSRKSVNLYKINKHSKEGDNIIVPGKVLSEGVMDHKVNITAMEFSASALAKLTSTKCSVKKLDEMLKLKEIKVIV